MLKTSRRVSPLHAASSGEMLSPQLHSDDADDVRSVAAASQIFFETPTFYQNYFTMRNTADVTGGKPIAVDRSLSQSF
jgi:hypothetical protein